MRNVRPGAIVLQPLFNLLRLFPSLAHVVVDSLALSIPLSEVRPFPHVHFKLAIYESLVTDVSEIAHDELSHVWIDELAFYEAFERDIRELEALVTVGQPKIRRLVADESLPKSFATTADLSGLEELVIMNFKFFGDYYGCRQWIEAHPSLKKVALTADALINSYHNHLLFSSETTSERSAPIRLIHLNLRRVTSGEMAVVKAIFRTGEMDAPLLKDIAIAWPELEELDLSSGSELDCDDEPPNPVSSFSRNHPKSCSS